MNPVNKNLHFGCGSVYFDGWNNVDLDSPLADLNLDLTQPLPFADASVSYMFSEHFIEHVTRKQAVDFLVECRRILRPGGTIRASTPNLRFLIAAYLALEVGEWGELWQPATPCSLMNEGMRSWGHQYLYDAEELVMVFKEAGFSSVVFQRYQDSLHPELAGRESRPFHHDLIVEATKCDGELRTDYSVIRQDEQLWFQQFARLEALEQTVGNQAAYIGNVEAELRARGEHIAGLEQTIADQATHIGNVEAELRARGEHIAGLEQTIGDQATHIGNVEAELNRLKSSLTWRLTAPIRQFSKSLKLK